MNRICQACKTEIPTGCAVLRGNAHNLSAYHRGCFTLVRAVAGVDVPAVASEFGPLTRRMVEAGIL